MLARQRGVVNGPSQSSCMSGDAMLLSRILDPLRSVEDGIFMVACHRALVRLAGNIVLDGPGLTGRVDLTCHVLGRPTTVGVVRTVATDLACQHSRGRRTTLRSVSHLD